MVVKLNYNNNNNNNNNNNILLLISMLYAHCQVLINVLMLGQREPYAASTQHLLDVYTTVSMQF